MCYKLIQIKKSSKFEIIDNKLLYSYDKLFYEDKVIYEGKVSTFDVFKSNVFIIDNYEKLVMLNLENHNIKEFNYIKGIDFILNENEIIYGNWNEDYTERFITRINLKTESKIWEVESYFGNGKIHNNNLFAVCNGNKICKISLTNPQTPLWQFDLSQLGTFYSEQSQQQETYKVKKFIGIHQDRLYVALNGGMLLEIDIATGAVTYQWQNIMTTDRGFSYPVETNTFTLDKQLGKLLSFYTADFITIDLASKKVNITPMDEELKKFDGRTFKPTSINYAIDETHIYTLVTLYAPEADFIKESIVAFNIQTKKIDWNFTDYQFGMAGGDTPKLAGNKLYLKVNITNLYIFEKTSNESI